MCFGDRKARTTTPPPRPVETATPHALRAPPGKLTKARPMVQVAPATSAKSSMEITWPLDRPVGDEAPRYVSPVPISAAHTPSPDLLPAPRPYRYEDDSVPPSNVPSLYSASEPSTPTDESLFDFQIPPVMCPPSPPPMCPPTPSSMGESLRVASLMPTPLVTRPNARRISPMHHPMPQRMRRAPTPPMPRVNIPAPAIPALPIDRPGDISPAFQNAPRSKTPSPTSSISKSSLDSPTSWTSHSTAATSPTSSKVPKTPKTPRSTKSRRSPTGNRKGSPSSPRRGSPTASDERPLPEIPRLYPVPERAAVSALQRARSMTASMRPKFSLPETLAPFSLAPPPLVMDLYEPPKPAQPRIAPVVPERTAPLEKVSSPGRIAVMDEDALDDEYSEFGGGSTPGLGYEKIRLFPIPDHIIHGEQHYQERRRQREEAARRSNEGSSRSSQDSSSGMRLDADARPPSPIGSLRPASFALGHLHSRFSMSSLGSTLRVHEREAAGYALARPASARPSGTAGVGGRSGSSSSIMGGAGAAAAAASGLGAIPTFPSRHEAKKARKLWLAEQEEAKRQSAKMGVEGILGWDATTRRWVNKMTDDEKEAWLNQWKEKRSAAQALQRGRSAPHRPSNSLDQWKPRPVAA